MKELVLNRFVPDQVPEAQLETRTFGKMVVGDTELMTIERPWIPIYGPLIYDPVPTWSKPFESCVPAGTYDLVKRDSPSKGERWHLVNEDLGIFLEKSDAESSGHEDARYSCMFHSANFWYQIVGCIGPGKQIANFGVSPDDKGRVKGFGVTSSKNALSVLERYLDGSDAAQLVIN